MVQVHYYFKVKFFLVFICLSNKPVNAKVLVNVSECSKE